MVQDFQRQLDNVQKIAEANAKRTLQDHQRQLSMCRRISKQVLTEHESGWMPKY